MDQSPMKLAEYGSVTPSISLISRLVDEQQQSVNDLQESLNTSFASQYDQLVKIIKIIEPRQVEVATDGNDKPNASSIGTLISNIPNILTAYKQCNQTLSDIQAKIDKTLKTTRQITPHQPGDVEQIDRPVEEEEEAGVSLKSITRLVDQQQTAVDNLAARLKDLHQAEQSKLDELLETIKTALSIHTHAEEVGDEISKPMDETVTVDKIQEEIQTYSTRMQKALDSIQENISQTLQITQDMNAQKDIEATLQIKEQGKSSISSISELVTVQQTSVKSLQSKYRKLLNNYENQTRSVEHMHTSLTSNLETLASVNQITRRMLKLPVTESNKINATSQGTQIKCSLDRLSALTDELETDITNLESTCSSKPVVTQRSSSPPTTKKRHVSVLDDPLIPFSGHKTPSGTGTLMKKPMVLSTTTTMTITPTTTTMTITPTTTTPTATTPTTTTTTTMTITPTTTTPTTTPTTTTMTITPTTTTPKRHLDKVPPSGVRKPEEDIVKKKKAKTDE